MIPFTCCFGGLEEQKTGFFLQPAGLNPNPCSSKIHRAHDKETSPFILKSWEKCCYWQGFWTAWQCLERFGKVLLQHDTENPSSGLGILCEHKTRWTTGLRVSTDSPRKSSKKFPCLILITQKIIIISVIWISNPTERSTWRFYFKMWFFLLFSFQLLFRTKHHVSSPSTEIKKSQNN